MGNIERMWSKKVKCPVCGFTRLTAMTTKRWRCPNCNKWFDIK